MGSSYYGPNSDCYHCNGCGTHRPCDDCTANCCQDNMNEHRRLRRLEDTFKDKVESAKKYINFESICLLSKLRREYNIFIPVENNDDNDELETVKYIIESMKLKKERIKKDSSNIREDESRKYKIKAIEYKHIEKMELIKNRFCKSIMEIENKNSDIKIQENEIEKKEKEKSQLQNVKDEIKNKYEKDFDNFKKEKENGLIKMFEKKKNEIDLKYNYLESIFEPNFEYSEEEKNEKNNLLQNINEIKKYSFMIPNYQIVIEKFEISNYLS